MICIELMRSQFSDLVLGSPCFTSKVKGLALYAIVEMINLF